MIRRALASALLASVLMNASPASANRHCYSGCGGEERHSETCRISLVPNLAVIFASISANNVQLGKAREEVDNRLEEIRKLLPAGSELVPLELSRNYFEPMRGNYVPNASAPEKSFLVNQSFEIRLPKSADADSLVDKLAARGNVTFGKGTNFGDGRGRPVVRFRVTDAFEQLDRGLNVCREQAIQKACRNAADGAAACSERSQKKAILADYNLQSQPLSGDYNQLAPLSLYYPGQTGQLNNLELNGDLTVTLNGTASFLISTAPAGAQDAKP